MARFAATCTETGLTEGKHCSICNAVLVKQETVPANGHTEVVDSAVAPTCTETGLTEGKHCSVCNAVLVEQTVVPTKEHTGGEATCLAQAICEVCNQPYGPLSEHKMEEVEPAIAPSCENPGMTAYYRCSVCQEAEIPSEEYGEPLNHAWDTAWTSDDDTQTHYHACTREGCDGRNEEAEHSYNEEHICSVCGAPEPVFVVGG